MRSKRARGSGFVVDIAGLPVRMRGTDKGRRDVLESLFGTLPPCSVDARAELVLGARVPAAPRRAPDETYPDLHVWHEGDVLHLVSEPHALRAMVTPDRALIGGPMPSDPQGVRRLFHPVITHILAHVDSFVVHAAAVRRADRGVLILGESGKGKSTMALAALDDGWELLSDDLVALRTEGQTTVIRGVPKPPAFPRDLAATSLDGAETLQWDWRRRRHLPVDRLDLRPTRLAAIVHVDHGTGSDATFDPISGDVAASDIMSSFSSVCDVPLMRRFFAVAVRAARVPRWNVYHGADPEVRLAEAARVLDALDALAETS